MRPLLAALAVHSLMSAASLVAQEPPPPAAATDTAGALAVFLDCDFNGCDFQYFQTELSQVSWVRDRNFADVHILVSGQSTGSGGFEYTVTFIGLRRFANLTDTLQVVTIPAASSDDRRKALLRTFRAGLVRYMSRTHMAERVSVSFGTASGASAGPAKKDPWHAWVFETSFGLWMQREQRSMYQDRYGNVGASRVTKANKTELGWYRNLSLNESEIDDTTTYKYSSNGYGISLLHAKSLGEHLSVGVRGSLSSSTYDNFKRVLRLTPAIEFNVFPYSQSTRRQLRIEYNAGYATFAYHDTTISDKIEESMPIQRLQISVSSREPWGNVNVGSNGVQYFNGGNNYRLGVFGGASLKLFKGFNLNFNGNYQSIHDQFFLTKNLFTPQEILTRQYQLPTNYRFWGNVNISYTFGSIFSTVVNPRFNGGFD